MKKFFSILLAGVTLLSLVACGNSNSVSSSPVSEADTSVETESGTQLEADEESQAINDSLETEQNNESEGTTDMSENESTNTLIAYFSRTGENYGVGVIEKGNTAIIAEMIAEETGGDLFEIKTVEEYPENYDKTTEIAQQELTENARPELAENLDNLDDYTVIYLGYPNWWGDMPMAVYTFLESQEWNGKTIIPFCTHAGSGLSRTESSIKETCTGAEVLDGLAITGTTAQNDQDAARTSVTAWLNELGMSR